MPRIDRTFSDDDIIRLINFYLTPQERQNVLNRLSITERRGLLEVLLDLLGDFLPIVGTILDVASLLGILFNQADVARAQEAASLITSRRNAIRRALNGD